MSEVEFKILELREQIMHWDHKKEALLASEQRPLAAAAVLVYTGNLSTPLLRYRFAKTTGSPGLLSALKAVVTKHTDHELWRPART